MPKNCSEIDCDNNLDKHCVADSCKLNYGLNIKQLIKENYNIAKSKGFYPDDSKIEDHLMGIVSELGEAYEAHRNNKFTNCTLYSLDEMVINDEHKDFRLFYFCNDVKDTFEDEIADVFIRLFNLCGWLKIDDLEDLKLTPVTTIDNSVCIFLLNTCHFVTSMISDKDYTRKKIEQLYSALIYYCNFFNINIKKHILAKMEYNKTREHLHGKKY